MLKPVDTDTGPPGGGWKFVDPKTGVRYHDNALGALLSRVYKSWSACELEIPPDWKEYILDQICQQNPRMECRENGESERHMTLDDVARFGKTIAHWMASGEGYVSAEESDRRARICLTCQYNKPVKMCLGCSSSLKWLAERIGMPQTRHDPQLQGCQRCGCLLKIKIHVPLGVIDNKGLEYPSFCWQNDQSAGNG